MYPVLIYQFAMCWFHQGTLRKHEMAKRHKYDRRPSSGLGDVIVNVGVRGFFCELIQILTDLHEEVEIHHGPVDIRAEYAGNCICRIVPYRELIHIQIGESPIWEVRVRNESAYLDAVDRILDVYLSFVSAASRPAPRYAGTSYLQR
jgi:hypothetical protein